MTRVLNIIGKNPHQLQPNLLFVQEIILVDDANDDPTVGSELEKLEKVNLTN